MNILVSYLKLFLLYLSLMVIKADNLYSDATDKKPIIENIIFEVKTSKDWLGMLRNILVSGNIKINEPGWNIKNGNAVFKKRQIHQHEIQVFTKLIKDYFKDKENLVKHNLRSLSWAYNRQHKSLETWDLKFIFERDGSSKTLSFPFKFKFTAGHPLGSNYILVSLLDKTKYLYWYRSK